MSNGSLFYQSLTASEKQLIFVGGKGGVGKTSVSSAIALELSENFETLLISTDPAHSSSDSLSSPKTAGKTIPFHRNLTLWELDSTQAFEAFKEKHAEEIRLLLDTSTYMDDEDINRMMGLMLPGIDEVMGLKSIVDTLSEKKYDKVVVDTAPTGHTLRLLFMPEILNSWIKTMAAMRWKYRTIQTTFKGKYTPDDADDMLLDLKRLVSRMKSILVDEKVCEFVLVCLPASMVIAETKRLYQTLREHNISVQSMVVNQVAPDGTDPFYHQLHVSQTRLLSQIEETFPEINLLKTPLFAEEVLGKEALSQFQYHLFHSKTIDNAE